MSDVASWQPWWPDPLLPVPGPDVLLTPEEDAIVIPEQPELSEAERLAQQLAAAQMQGREQGYAAGLAEGRSAGRDEGYQQGLDAGLTQGLEQARQQQAPVQAQMQQLVRDFQHALDALDGVIVTRLTQLALAAARQVIGGTRAPDDGALVAQIQHLLQQEPLFSGRPQLRVHPDDLALVGQMLGETLEAHGWRLYADPALHRGGCSVCADEGDLDASLATRWQALCQLAAPGGRG